MNADDLIPVLIAAESGEPMAVLNLLQIAVRATKYAEELCETQPELTKRYARVAGCVTGFPILWSWNQGHNEKRKKMVSDFEIWKDAKFKTTGVRFEPKHDLIELLVHVGQFLNEMRGSPLKPMNRANTGEWARMLAAYVFDEKPIDPSHTAFTLIGKERAMHALQIRTRRSFAALRKRADSERAAFGDPIEKTKLEVKAKDIAKRSAPTAAEFRNGFVEEVSAWLGRRLKK